MNRAEYSRVLTDFETGAACTARQFKNDCKSYMMISEVADV